jgi:hypothetical protein
MFRVSNLERAPYDVFVFGLPRNFYLKSILAGDQDVTGMGVDLTSDAPEDLTITISPDGGTVEGSVHNAEGEPAAGCLITVIPNADAPWLFQTSETDQSGHFTIRGVKPGDYKIYAWESVESGAYQDRDFVKPHESAGEALSIKERAHETVQLKLIPAESTTNAAPQP